jgi:hypothetical protein
MQPHADFDVALSESCKPLALAMGFMTKRVLYQVPRLLFLTDNPAQECIGGPLAAVQQCAELH